MTRPLITIVIPAHNRADVIERTLLSVSGQTCRDFKVVVVDNASTDSTAEVVARWAVSDACRDIDVRIISEPKPGACAARNAGLALVDTSWTMFFDSDDTMSATHVQRAVDAIGEHPDASIIGWDVRLHGLDGMCEVKPFADANAVYHCIMHGTMATQRYMARTELFCSAGGWNVNLMAWNDIELGVRLICATDGKGIVKLNGAPKVDVYAQAASITGIDYSHKARACAESIDSMGRFAAQPVSRGMVPMKWIALKRMTLAALCAAESGHDPELVKELKSQALAGADTPWQRLVLRILYQHVRRGWRGGVRMLGPLL